MYNQLCDEYNQKIADEYTALGFLIGLIIGSLFLYFLIHNNIMFDNFSIFTFLNFINDTYKIILIIALISGLIFILLNHWSMMKNE